jgi:arsenate reductase
MSYKLFKKILIMITIYHNPRCSKSRTCNNYLSHLDEEVRVVNYFNEPFTVNSLKKVIQMLGIAPIDLVRKNEQIWRIQFKGKELTDNEVIKAMVTHPKLIERPIVVNNGKAVIARPLENVDKVL